MKLPFARKREEPTPLNDTKILSPTAKKVRRRKIKEVKKPWGMAERVLVLLFLLTTTSISAYLAIKARNKTILPHVSLTIPKMEVKSEDTIILENKLPKEKIANTITAIKNMTGGLSGTYGVWAEDMSGSYAFGISEGQQFEGASFFKLPLVIAVYEEVEKGNINLNDNYILHDSDKMPGSGILVGYADGTVLSYQAIVKALLSSSDNTAFNILYTKVGGEPRILTVINEIGMKNTSFDDSLTTPYDMGLLFKKLMKLELVSQNSRDQILEYLTNTDYEEYLPKGITDVRVAHKFGHEVRTINDGGIILGPRPFVLVIMSKDIDENEANTAIPQIAKLIYTELK